MNRLIWTFSCVLSAVTLVHGAPGEELRGGIDDLLDVLNLQRLRSRLAEGRWKSHGVIGEHAAPCIAEVSAYLEALRRGAAWADMMCDATGRYSSQFTFGNGFWLGSKTLCLELDQMASKKMEAGGKAADGLDKGGTLAATSSTLTSSPDKSEESSNSHRRDENNANDTSATRPRRSPRGKGEGVVPPYRLRFFVARIEIQLPEVLSPKPRQVLLGVCMPRSCSPQTIGNLIDTSAATQEVPTAIADNGDKALIGRSAKVLRVRPVPGDYDWRKDPKTFVLGGVTAVVLVLMAMAEAYESLQRCRYRVDDEGEIGPKQKSNDTERGKNNNEEIGTLSKRRVFPNDSSQALLPRLLVCFSARRNGRKILCGAENAGKGEDQSLACIHGLRVISLAWVIMVHTYLQVFAIAENKKLRSLTERAIVFQTVSNATFSVDTFFMISGLLVAYLYFRANQAKGAGKEGGDSGEGMGVDAAVGKGKMMRKCPKRALSTLCTDVLIFFKLLGYRFLRLTPPYLWSIGLAEIGMRCQLNGSVFEPQIDDGVTCAKYWWRNALYINSLFPKKEMCMLWSWYMANDTQFYAVGIMLLLVAVRYFRFAAIAGMAFLVSSWITTAIIAIQFEYHVSIPEPFALFDQLYDKPWTRLGPYLVGMSTGWLLHKTAFRIKIPKVALASGWVLSLCCMVSLVYGVALVGHPLAPSGAVGLDIMASAAYASLGHTVWALAVAWLVVACSTGNGGWISGILCWSALRPLSRLAYCAFLIHPLVMLLTALQMDGPLHLQNSVVIMIYLGYMAASYFLSFLLSICFEAPAVSLLKIAFNTSRQNRSGNNILDQGTKAFKK